MFRKSKKLGKHLVLKKRHLAGALDQSDSIGFRCSINPNLPGKWKDFTILLKTRSKCFLGRKIVRISDFFGDSLIDDIEDRYRQHFSVIPAAMT